MAQGLGRLLESTGSSLLLAWLLAAGWQISPDPRLSGILVAAWLAARRAGALIRPRLGVRAARLAGLLGVMPLLLVLIAVPPDSPYRLPLLVLAFGGWMGGFLVAEQVSRVTLHRPSRPVSRVFALSSRLGLVAGGALASVLLIALPGATIPVGLAALVGGSLLSAGAALWLYARQAPTSEDRAARPPEGLEQAAAASEETTSGSLFLPLTLPRRQLYLLAAASCGALLAGLIAWLPQLLVVGAGIDVAFTGAAFALLGAGALVRLPVVRLRNRLPPALLVVALTVALAVVTALVALLGPWLLGLALLPFAGLLAATMDGEHLIALRRHGPPRIIPSVLIAAFAAGQLTGALAVAALGAAPVDLGGPVLLIALGAVAAAAVALVLDRRSLRALRHQVQQFSWNSDPLPRPFDPPVSGTRLARLGRWVHREVETELVDVTLPVSGRRYAIARPSGEGRDILFERAKADPERQMPYWAKVWPSGVALADVVIERADEVRDRQVLELGAGLGVTAAAVLQEGGKLVTADYAPLPLALCRLNGLLNSGRAPGSICFNWRDPEQVREVLRRHPPIGLILAADVLYEFRDIAPLIDVIERLLAPGGSLWLAEPVRRTAQRFLDMVAADGWHIESRRIRAAWPDATNGWVNVHIISREAQPTEMALVAGGWQP
jgi:predicted nicotinamide N-methyase